jgi:PRD1 phage membrane DNA delivery
MNTLVEGIVTIAVAIVGVAILSVLVSQKSQTPQVLGAAGSAFANALSAATGPTTGATASPSVSSGSSFRLGGMYGSLSFPMQTNTQ